MGKIFNKIKALFVKQHSQRNRFTHEKVSPSHAMVTDEYTCKTVTVPLYSVKDVMRALETLQR